VNIESVNYMLMDRAVAFYRDVMGLEVRSQSPMWSEFAYGDAVVALHGGGQGDFNETGLSIQVSDIESACAEVKAGGGQIRKAPESRPSEPIKLAELTDSEGNGFSLTQYVG
jgi:predicted enzyme related to lactoylglutathione lyase